MAEYNGECGRVGGKCVRAEGGDSGGGGKPPTTLITNLAEILPTDQSRSETSFLVCPQERANVHDDQKRRALAQPRHDVAVRAGGAGTSRLAHHAGAHDESDVWLEEVR